MTSPAATEEARLDGPVPTGFGPRHVTLRRLLNRPALIVPSVVLLAFVARIPSFVHQLFDPDEAAIAAQAIALRDGGTLYVDAIDRKPPIPAFLYSWVFDLTGSTSLIPVHVLAAVALAGAAIIVAVESRRRWGTWASWWAGGLMVAAAIGFVPTDAQAANYAHFALLPGTAAVVAARRGGWRSAFVAGVGLGLAVLCRQTWAIGLLPCAVAIVVAGRWRHLWALAAGCVVPVAVTSVFVPFGDFWSWTFTSNRDFVLSSADWGAVLQAFGGNLGLFVGFHVVVVVLLAAALRHRRLDWSAWRADADLWLWLATGCVAVAAGLRFYGHYWIQLLPPAVLLVAPYAARLRGRRLALGVAGVLLPTLVAYALAFTPSTVRTLANPHPVASYVRAHTGPDDRILVWGNFPEVYWAADRPPAGGFVTSNFVTGLSGDRTPGPSTFRDVVPGARRTFLAELRQHPPVLVLDTSTARLRQYGHYPLSSIPALAAFVAARYRVVAHVDGITIYRRR